MKKQIVLSAFDGMSCGQIALNRIGIVPEVYYASEIDKYAQAVSKANYTDTVYVGDIRKVDVGLLREITLFIGGSPCQSFSFAGKRKGMSTKDEIEILELDQYLELKEQGFEFEGQSYLFWEYMRVLTDIRKYNPDVKFLLENVMMGEKWQRVLTRAIGINPICINSALVSAQNRNRLYWTDIGVEPDGLFGDLVCKIHQPKDKGIFLRDVLEEEVDDKYFLSEKALQSLQSLQSWQKRNEDNGNGFKAEIRNEDEKSAVLSTGSQKSSSTYIKINKQGNVSPNQDKASCFTAGGHSGGNHSDMDLIVHNMMPRSSTTGKGGTGPLSRSDGKTYCLDTGNTNAVEIKCVRMTGRDPENPKSRKPCDKTEQMIEERLDDKTGALTTVQKDNMVRVVKQLNPSKESHGQQPFQQNRIYDVNGIAPVLNAQLNNGSNMVSLVDSRIRRLTPLECERLQTVPDGYTNHVSDSQRYKMLGNGWTVDVVAHIFSYLK